MPSIVLNNLSKSFDSRAILSGVQKEVVAGEFVAILGASGVGKTTLLRLIAGLETPTSGTIQLGDGLTHDDLAFVFQAPHLLPWRSVAGNVALPLQLKKVASSEAQSRVDDVLKLVELTDARNLQPHQLSGGMQMRTSLARALVTRPRLMLMDEPFAALDELTRHRLQEELRALWCHGRMTILYVTHSLMEAAFLADRIWIISKRKGQIVQDRGVKLPKERSKALRLSPEYCAEVSELQRAFEEVGE